MLRATSEKKYQQLNMVARLATQQLFMLQDFIELLDAIHEGRDCTNVLEQIHSNFPLLSHTNNTLISLLIDLNILRHNGDKEPQPSPEPPPVKIKPNFTVITEDD